MNLLNQPTRKTAAVGWTSLLGPIMAAIIAPWLPGSYARKLVTA